MFWVVRIRQIITSFAMFYGTLELMKNSYKGALFRIFLLYIDDGILKHHDMG